MKKKFLLCAAALCLNGIVSSLEAVSVRAPGVDVDVGGPYGYYTYYDNASYQAWAGPGWYYGMWFDQPDDYYYWLTNNFYDSYWAGPGWYYGIYFKDEVHFNDFRKYHRHYGKSNPGDLSYHKRKNRGRWDSKDHRKSDQSTKR